MIKKFMLVCSLMVGGSPWTLAQTPQVKLASDGNLPMSISQLFEKIEDNNKELRTSKTGVEAANLGIESAKSKRLPDLDASLSFSYIGNALLTDRNFSNVHGLKSPHVGNNFALQAQQVVYAGGAINAGIKLAELGKLQAEVGVKLTRQQARFIALGQYLDLYKIDNRIRVYEKNIELTRQLIDDIKEKQKQGMALKNDITRYELQMESLKLGLTALHNNRSILNHQLCNTLDIDAGKQIIPDATIADKNYAKDGEAYWQSASLVSSPLMEQSNNAIRIAEQKEKIAKSDLLPKVAFVAADNFDGPILFELPPGTGCLRAVPADLRGTGNTEEERRTGTAELRGDECPLSQSVGTGYGYGRCFQPQAQCRIKRSGCPHQHRLCLLSHEIHSRRNLETIK